MVVLKVADFERAYAEHARWKGDEAMPYEAFRSSHTDGRRQEVSGKEWEDLVQALQSPASHTQMAARQFGYFRDMFVFHADEQPVSTLKRLPLHGYLSINNGKYWLTLRHDYPQEFDGLPRPYWRPFKWYGLALVALGALTYIIIPRKKRSPGDIRYPKGRSIIAPDVLGLFFTPVTVLLPCLVVWSTSPGTSIFSVDRGWIWLTFAFWLLAACGVAFLLVGFKYSRLAYRIAPDGLHELRGTRDMFFPWDEIDYFQSYESKLSSRLGWLLLLFGRSFSSAGLGLVMLRNNEVGIKVYRRNGEAMTIMANELSRFYELEQALKANGVKRKRKQST
ncbi:hypothetical protein JCM12178A_31190 [Salidesulfovibrio brasiliensis]